MEVISQQLDDTVLEIFDVLEHLYEAQDKLAQLMKHGFLNMSRARKSMGVKNVSADQIIRANILASVKVSVDEDLIQPSSEEEVGERELFQMLQNVEKKIDEQDKTTPPVTSSDSSSGPRKRHTEKSSKSDPDKQDKENGTKAAPQVESSEESDISNRVVTNSLSLFGILVPPTLRASQKHFNDSLKVCVELANLKHRLHILKLKYRDLYEKKKSDSDK
ncbi:coiled-coil domain-containing protein 115 isoform X1 [Biomphalaria pfeifferi]|uniref:Vacuolar ATPase assembly protein VMA22 n=1 Tax=Biomphalaria pfeifferi TaxID=112525 RepID=A0AAD8FFL1_BIOPF|nr:coiled-coil domain-containing protein 115 isoform X1 [Biomphalaria pfeifferi]